MKKITVEGIQINFNDLTEQKQIELYQKNKKKYKQDAMNSIYISVRIAVVKDEKESSEVLNEMLRTAVKDELYGDVEQAIFNNTIFMAEEETMNLLATSDLWHYRMKAAELSKDSKLLNEMLRKEVNDEQDDDVEKAIFNNGFFEIEEETAKQLASQDNSYYRKIAAELSKDSNMLLEMFVSEMQADEVDEDVLKIIIKNDAFIFEKKALLEYIQNNY